MVGPHITQSLTSAPRTLTAVAPGVGATSQGSELVSRQPADNLDKLIRLQSCESMICFG